MSFQFAAAVDRVMERCCPPGGAAGADCELPAACDNSVCADEFLPFFDACFPKVSVYGGAPFTLHSPPHPSAAYSIAHHLPP